MKYKIASATNEQIETFLRFARDIRLIRSQMALHLGRQPQNVGGLGRALLEKRIQLSQLKVIVSEEYRRLQPFLNCRAAEDAFDLMQEMCPMSRSQQMVSLGKNPTTVNLKLGRKEKKIIVDGQKNIFNKAFDVINNALT